MRDVFLFMAGMATGVAGYVLARAGGRDRRLAAALASHTQALADAVAANGPTPPRPETGDMANPVLGQLEDQVTRTNGVIESATTLIAGFKARLDKAVSDAVANGATADELAPLSDLSAALGTDTDALAAAVEANTPAAAKAGKKS